MAAARTLLVARREMRLLSRSRMALGALALLTSVAWLPVILIPLRRGTLGVPTFTEMLPLQIALEAVILPLLALLVGAELFAGELEDGSLIPALTQPISRRSCFAGKCLGRATMLTAAYVAAFGSATLTVALVQGSKDWKDAVAVAAAGLLLALSTGGLGAALGSAGTGRVRAFGEALVGWLVLVFALDAALLTLVVVLAPPPPDSIGVRGHGELAAPRTSSPIHDPHAREAEPEAPTTAGLPARLMALSPVSLFRLTSLATSPNLRPRLGLALPSQSSAGLWTTILVGWLVWLVAPLAVGLFRFLRADLS